MRTLNNLVRILLPIRGMIALGNGLGNRANSGCAIRRAAVPRFLIGPCFPPLLKKRSPWRFVPVLVANRHLLVFLLYNQPTPRQVSRSLVKLPSSPPPPATPGATTLPSTSDMESTSTAASTALLLELVAALGGSYAFYKLVGPFIYNECFAAADDDEVRMLEAGLFPPTERSPLLANGASPRPNSIRLAMQMYNAHIAQSSSAGSTPAATQSGLSTPVSASPSTPVSAASSYFDLRQPPLYVKDVTTALEKEAKRRTSSEFMAANFSAGFGMSTPSDGTRTPGFRSIAGSSRPTTPAMRPTLTMTRRFSNPGAPRSKPFSEE